MRNGVVLVVVLGLAVALGVLRAHASPSSTAAPTVATAPTPTPAPPPGTIYIEPGINGGTPHYVPPAVTIRVGDTLTWVDRDTGDHSATSDDGKFDTGVLSPNQSRSIKFTTSGTFPYSDIIESDMSGVVRVIP
jgi:plastocyanin